MSARYCLVCAAPATVALGIRARYENTNAVWAPNLDAHLCKLHAISGADIEIVYRPTETGHVHAVTRNQIGEVVSAIRLSIGSNQSPPEQASLL